MKTAEVRSRPRPCSARARAARHEAPAEAPTSTTRSSTATFPIEGQQELEHASPRALRLRAGATGGSTRPSTRSRTASAPTDIRITTRYSRARLESLFSTHARVRARPLRAAGRPGARADAAGQRGVARDARVAEPRMWENLVGRSLPFWRRFYPRAAGGLPRRSSGRSTLERLLPRGQQVEPSLIRVDADEVTYNLHIILRFELEQEIIDGADRARGRCRGVERADEGVPRRRRAGRRARRAAGRALVGRRASGTSRRTRSATSSPPRSGRRCARRCRIWTSSSRRRVRRPCASGWAERPPPRAEVHAAGDARRVAGAPLDAGPYLRYLKDKVSELAGAAA